ncbi:hypothetical protein PT2222_90235 [Paraburkholderia tropica]
MRHEAHLRGRRRLCRGASCALGRCNASVVCEDGFGRARIRRESGGNRANPQPGVDFGPGGLRPACSDSRQLTAP